MIKFTIAIPAYKARFIKECINSILLQTFQNFELVIVNDASPDNLDEIVFSYNDSRIRYYKNEKNFGAENVVDNWNKCLSYATGEYFILMGDDDKMMPEYLEEFNILISKYSTFDVLHCRSYIINDNSLTTDITMSLPEYETTYENIWYRIGKERSQYISDFVYKTQPLKNRGGFYKLPLAWATDDISAYIASYPNGIAHINKPILQYRKNALNISSSTSNVHIKLRTIDLEKEWIENFIVSNPPILEDDIIFCKMINKRLSAYALKKKTYAIASTLRRNGFRNLLKWVCNRNKYNLPLSVIIYAYIESFKIKKIQKV